MPRTRIEIGGYGSISFRQMDRRKVRALAAVRDSDGRLRQVTATGSSNADARRALLAAIAKRVGFTGGDITATTTLADAAKDWLGTIERKVEEGARSANTLRVYRLIVNTHIVPGLGEVQLCEATVARIDRFLLGMRQHHGAGAAKTTRTVLSGILAHAIRLGAMPTNPVRDVSPIVGRRKRAPRALTAFEREDWLAKLAADEVAVANDLVDLTMLMLATGSRIGEMLAATFDDIDVDDKVIRIDWTISRITGQGLVRGPTKSAAGSRTLPLPGWAVDVLIRRGDVLGWAGPVFPAVATREGGYDRRGGGWRDPSNTLRQFREARERAGYGWVTSHSFRKTVATVMDQAGMTAREIADHLGHARISMTMDNYLGRKTVGDAVALEGMFES